MQNRLRQNQVVAEQITTIASIASSIGKLLDHYGLDKFSIAKQVGLDTDISYQPGDRISTAKLQKVWSIIKQQVTDDNPGLTYASLIQPASLCGLGLAWITSDSLKDSINRLVRFQRALSTAFYFQLNELDDSYQIILTIKTVVPVDISLDATVATLLQMCRITYGPELKVARVCIAHEEPLCVDKFNQFFGVKVEFNTSETQLFFPKNTFERTLATANPDLARMNDQVVIAYLKQFDKKNLSLQVRAHIIEELNNGVPQQKKIAQVLNLSLRNLQRKLKDEGLSYKHILDSTRMELSQQYLRGSNRSIIEIGFLLGFTEPSNFARAFRRWTGVSPVEYRQTT